MKKKIIMGLFVLATVIGMGFAATRYACGHVKSQKGSLKLMEKCPECKKVDDHANKFEILRAEVCTKPDDELTVKDSNFYECDTYNNNNASNNN